MQAVGWVFPKWGDEGRGTRWPPQTWELWGEMERSTEAGISSDHYQYPKLREETFIRVSGESSMAERTPGKSVIPYSLYWNLLKSLILGGCICLSLQLGFFTEYLWDHTFMPCPICCLRTLGPKSKPLFCRGIKCQLTAGIQSSASHCFFQYGYWNWPSCLGWWLMCQRGPDASRTAPSRPRAAALQRLHLLQLQEGIS